VETSTLVLEAGDKCGAVGSFPMGGGFGDRKKVGDIYCRGRCRDFQNIQAVETGSCGGCKGCRCLGSSSLGGGLGGARGVNKLCSGVVFFQPVLVVRDLGKVRVDGARWCPFVPEEGDADIERGLLVDMNGARMADEQIDRVVHGAS
jgi:hypothetical protein